MPLQLNPGQKVLLQALEREWYERRVDTLERRIERLEEMRVAMEGAADGVRGTAASRQLELLRKQRDEALNARELAVDELRQRVVQEGHLLAAMRHGFGEGAEQLKAALEQLPLTDESMSHEQRERQALKRRLELSRQRLAHEGVVPLGHFRVQPRDLRMLAHEICVPRAQLAIRPRRRVQRRPQLRPRPLELSLVRRRPPLQLPVLLL